MPTRKQRRRREKGRRHEYEYVYVDEEGREVEVDDAEEAEAARPQGREPAAADGKRPKASRTGARAGRTVQPPSWRRVGKRGLIFAPLMFLVVTILSPDFSTAERIQQTLFLLLVFLPFSYVMDSMTYRMWRRRAGAAEGSSERRKGG